MLYNKKKYDVIIVGFGLVSKLLISSISSLDIKICVINRKIDVPQFNIKRGIALNYTSCLFLRKIKLFEKIKPYINKIEKISISENKHRFKVNLKSEDVNNEYLSYVIEESILQKLIVDSINYNKLRNHINGRVKWNKPRFS